MCCPRDTNNMEDLGLSLLKVIYSALEISERDSWKIKVCMCVHVCVCVVGRYRRQKCVGDTKTSKTDLKKTVNFCLLVSIKCLNRLLRYWINAWCAQSILICPLRMGARFRHFKLPEFQDDTEQLWIHSHRNSIIN